MCVEMKERKRQKGNQEKEDERNVLRTGHRVIFLFCCNSCGCAERKSSPQMNTGPLSDRSVDYPDCT